MKTRKVHFFTKITKFLPKYLLKLITKILLFSWRSCVLVRNFTFNIGRFIRTGCLIEPWIFNWSLFCLDVCGQEWPCIYKFPKIAGRCTKLDDEAVVFKVVSNERMRKYADRKKQICTSIDQLKDLKTIRKFKLAAFFNNVKKHQNRTKNVYSAPRRI